MPTGREPLQTCVVPDSSANFPQGAGSLNSSYNMSGHIPLHPYGEQTGSQASDAGLTDADLLIRQRLAPELALQQWVNMPMYCSTLDSVINAQTNSIASSLCHHRRLRLLPRNRSSRSRRRSTYPKQRRRRRQLGALVQNVRYTHCKPTPYTDCHSHRGQTCPAHHRSPWQSRHRRKGRQ